MKEFFINYIVRFTWLPVFFFSPFVVLGAAAHFFGPVAVPVILLIMILVVLGLIGGGMWNDLE